MNKAARIVEIQYVLFFCCQNEINIFDEQSISGV